MVDKILTIHLVYDGPVINSFEYTISIGGEFSKSNLEKENKEKRWREKVESTTNVEAQAIASLLKQKNHELQNFTYTIIFLRIILQICGAGASQ